MTRSLVFVGILGLGIVIGVILTRAVVRPPAAPTVKTSLALGDDAARRFILTHVKAIQWPSGDGTVSLSPAGGSPTQNQNITLIGQTPQTLPDDHGSTTLAVINVSGGAASVVSVSEFHHGSFGENLVTIDCRVIEVELSQDGKATPHAGDAQAETPLESQPALTVPQTAGSEAQRPAQAAETKDGQAESEQTVHEAWVPDYSDDGPSVLQIVGGQLRPGIRKEIKPEEANSADVWSSMVRQVGDVAWNSGSGDTVIASGRSAVLSVTPLDTVANQDLSDKLQNKLIISRAEAPPGTNVILKTVAGKYALLQIGIVNDRRLQLFWIDQPNGSARFSKAALTALAGAGQSSTAISVLTDLASPEGKFLDISKAALLSSPVKMTEPSQTQEDALRAIRKVADLAYWNGRLIAGSEKMAFLGRGQLLDFADKNAAEAIRRRGGPWLSGSKIEPDSVFVVMARDGKYALCRVIAKQGSTISIRWVMQQNDKPKFNVRSVKVQREPKMNGANVTVEMDRAVSLATTFVTEQNSRGTFVLTAPAKVQEFPTFWEVSFGRPPDQQADPAFGVVRVDKETGKVTWIPQE